MGLFTRDTVCPVVISFFFGTIIKYNIAVAKNSSFQLKLVSLIDSNVNMYTELKKQLYIYRTAGHCLHFRSISQATKRTEVSYRV